MKLWKPNVIYLLFIYYTLCIYLYTLANLMPNILSISRPKLMQTESWQRNLVSNSFKKIVFYFTSTKNNLTLNSRLIYFPR